MFKTRSPWPFIIISIIIVVVALIAFALTGSTEISGHWEFTF